MKNSVIRINRNLSRRLREARHECGLSTHRVAELITKRLPISHATVANYERGDSMPPVDVLILLADLYKRPLNWFLETREGLSGFRYRNLKSRVSAKDKRQFEATSGKWVDAYVALERHMRRPLPRVADDVAFDVTSSPKKLASEVRKYLKLRDDQPVQNVMDALHAFSIRVIEVVTDLEIDGLAARRGDDFVVVLNPRTSNDRLRMNALHELAHVIYDDCKGSGNLDDASVEKRAHEFASCLLLPDNQLRQAFEGQSFLRLLQFKERFGISLSAMIYRAEHLRLIRSTVARKLWIEMSRRGWRKNEPGSVWRDRAIRFETLLEEAIETRLMRWDDAEAVTGINKRELQTRLQGVTEPLNLPDPQEDERPDVLAFSSSL